MSPPLRPLPEVENARLESLLVERGVRWPLGGYAPGMYMKHCRKCAGRHMADKRANVCLPCAVAAAIGSAGEGEGDDRFAAGVAEGRRRATADVVRALGIEVLS